MDQDHEARRIPDENLAYNAWASFLIGLCILIAFVSLIENGCFSRKDCSPYLARETIKYFDKFLAR